MDLILNMNKMEFKNKIFTVGDVSFEMVAVHGGTFMMGAADDIDGDAGDDEKPAHKVYLSDYHLGKYEVTRELWRAVMVSDPPEISMINDDTCPVEKISWFDAMEFIEKLNAMTGERFRLPTEAEWEYAARGGEKSQNFKYSGSNNAAHVAWCFFNSGCMINPVGHLKANELGICDMSGNVWEWCADWYGRYEEGDVMNPTGPSEGERRVLRGGSWDFGAEYCRNTNRNSSNPKSRFYVSGFRLAL